MSDVAAVCAPSASATGGLGGAHSIALSPDGQNAYVASENGALSTFNRASNGTLTFVSCIKDQGSTEACPQNSPHAGDLAGAHAVDISSDGKFVYVAASTGSTDAVTVFSRNTGTGALTPVSSSDSGTTDECISEEVAACRQAVGLKGVAYLVIRDPSVYTVSPGGTVVRLARNGATGGLSQSSATADCFRSTTSSNASCGGANATQGLEGAAAAAVPPDGKNLYVVSRTSNALVKFARSATDGSISAPTCQHGTNSSDCSAGTGIGGLNDAQAIAATDANVYITAGPGSLANTGNTVATFTRNSNTGALTETQCYRESTSTAEATACATGTAAGLTGADAVAVTSDGEFVYVAASDGSDVAEFSRNTGNGDVTQLPDPDTCVDEPTSTPLECPSANRGGKGLAGASWIVAGPVAAPNNVYVTGPTEHAVAQFRIERAPSCTDTSVFTPHGKAETGTLESQCLDPNGDVLTFQEVSDPTNGTLALNSNGGYTYTPDPDFTGVDSFRFRANDGHVDTRVVTVTIHVAAPPPCTSSLTITRTGFRSKITRSQLFGSGIQFTETTNEKAFVDNDLLGSAKGLGIGRSKKFNILLASQGFGLNNLSHKVRLKVDPADVNTTKSFKLRVRITATDPCGKRVIRFKGVKVT